jgi:hypothetical protein
VPGERGPQQPAVFRQKLQVAVPIEGVDAGGMVVLSARGTLPSFVPGVPGLPVRMTARMHEEEAL